MNKWERNEWFLCVEWKPYVMKVTFPERAHISLTVGLLYGAGAETLIFVTGTLGKKIVPRQTTKVNGVYPEKQEKLVFRYPVLRSKPQRWIPELLFEYPPLRKFQNRSGRDSKFISKVWGGLSASSV